MMKLPSAIFKFLPILLILTSNVGTSSILVNDENKSQFLLQHVDSSLFVISHTNPQQVIVKDSTMTFQNVNTSKLDDPGFSFSLTKTQFDREVNNVGLIFTLYFCMQYINNKRDKTYSRFNFIKSLTRTRNQPVSGSGLKFSLQSDPDQLIDQLFLLHSE